jgi:DNA-directed RNA polymerase specialized sigma24 family protein
MNYARPMGIRFMPMCAAGAIPGRMPRIWLTEGALRVAVHRLRQRYRQLLRDEISQTLNDPAQVADELQSLQAALASP